MPLTPQQLEIKEEYRKTYSDKIQEFADAPEELKLVLTAVWLHMENEVAVEGAPEIRLAAASSLIHLRKLSQEFTPEDIQTLVDLLIGLALSE